MFIPLTVREMVHDTYSWGRWVYNHTICIMYSGESSSIQSSNSDVVKPSRGQGQRFICGKCCQAGIQLFMCATEK